MSFLDRMAARAVGVSPAVSPRLRSRFEPSTPNAGVEPMELDQLVESTGPATHRAASAPNVPPETARVSAESTRGPSLSPSPVRAAHAEPPIATEPVANPPKSMPPGVPPEPARAELPRDAIAGEPAAASSRMDPAGGGGPPMRSTPTDAPAPETGPPRVVETIGAKRFAQAGLDRADETPPATLDDEPAFAPVPVKVVATPARRRSGEPPAPERIAAAAVAIARRRDAPTLGRPETGRPEAAADAEPTVHVHIGRIDVKAVTPPPPAGRRAFEPPIESLDDYLRRSSGRR